MARNRTPPLAIQQEFFGKKIWKAKVLHGNNLSIHLGSKLSVLERISTGIYEPGEEGSHKILAYYAEWTLEKGGKLRCGSNQAYEDLVDLIRKMEGRLFISVSMNSEGEVKIEFDEDMALKIDSYSDYSWKYADFLSFHDPQYTFQVYRKRGFSKRKSNRVYETVLSVDGGPVPDFLKKIVADNQWEVLLHKNKKSLN